jgi:hypothetical protein
MEKSVAEKSNFQAVDRFREPVTLRLQVSSFKTRGAIPVRASSRRRKSRREYMPCGFRLRARQGRTSERVSS